VIARPAAGLLAALWLTAPPAHAQTPAGASEPPQPRFEANVDVVSVTAVVFDKSGQPVHGLGPHDVELLEDGIPQQVTYFREASGAGDPAARIPLSVVLVLDTSGSMRDSLRFLQEAVLSFVYKLEDADRTLVVSFNDSVKGSVDFTGDTERLELFVDALQAWGGTSLYDAIQYSLQRIRDQPGRKALIVFSDGDDTTSALKSAEVIDYARSVEATVHAIGFKGTQGGPRGFLSRIAAETGGQFFAPHKVGDLLRVFAEISRELMNHYLLSYTPSRGPDGSWRRITLRVKRPGCEVRVRKGYFAVARRRAD
jgi:Ca-activated chloride channel family protein